MKRLIRKLLLYRLRYLFCKEMRRITQVSNMSGVLRPSKRWFRNQQMANKR